MKKVALFLGLGAFLMVSCVKNEQKPEQESQVSDVISPPCRQTKAATELSDRVDVQFTQYYFFTFSILKPISSIPKSGS